MGEKAAGMIILAMPLMMLIFNLTMVMVIYKGGVSINAGDMTTGDLLSFISYVMEILMSLMMIAMLLVMVARERPVPIVLKRFLMRR